MDLSHRHGRKIHLAIRLIPYIQIGEYDDIKSLYSEQSELEDETVFALKSDRFF